MSQDFYGLDRTKNVSILIPRQQSSIEAVASSFSGTEFPTNNLFVGMMCFRTDLLKLYQYTAADTWYLILDFSSGTATAPMANKALQDAIGNVITTTYATQTALATTNSNVATNSNAINAVARVVSTNTTAIGANTPTGVLQMWTTSTAPTGWLICDGSAVSRTLYTTLYAVIGTTYGSGNGSTTFNLPDLTDKVPQGASTTNVIGTVKSAGLPDITGGITWYGNRNGCPNGSSGAMVSGTRNDGIINTMADSASGYSLISKVDFAASVCNSIYGNSTTVQPPALCINFIIKY